MSGSAARMFLALLVLSVLGGLILARTIRLDPPRDRADSQGLIDTADTRLGRALSGLVGAHPGSSGIWPIHDGRDAFADRFLLAEAADRSLDVQYYIWRPDMSGVLLAEALYRAAERGVRVRLLLDDNNTAGMDPMLAALDSHPNIEVRLFNPFSTRRFRLLGYLGDFARLNRRMHNKSFTADNQATIVGGRNVGDEYFSAGQAMRFVDLDVLVVGPVVGKVTADFDRYWASESSYPLPQVLGEAARSDPADVTRRASLAERDPRARAYLGAVRESGFLRSLLQGEIAFEWTNVQLVSDDPAKGLGKGAPDGLISQRLRRVLGGAEREVELVTPYFVPTEAGVRALSDLVARGVTVSVLTNALEATDVIAVHAGYARHRVALLRAGVRLFELKREAAGVDQRDVHRLAGSSSSSLHAKVFSVDRRRLFVGSFNFDPRSANLNTEMGLLIDSPRLAQGMVEGMHGVLPGLAYEVSLATDGTLRWVERGSAAAGAVPGDPVVHEREPDAGFWSRLGVWITSHLPVEWML
jgi:putative cardiolipin synthase